MEEITAFKSKDGTIFDKKSKCMDAEAISDLENEISKIVEDFWYHEIGQDSVVRELMENRHKLAQILIEFDRNIKQSVALSVKGE